MACLKQPQIPKDRSSLAKEGESKAWVDGKGWRHRVVIPGGAVATSLEVAVREKALGLLPGWWSTGSGSKWPGVTRGGRRCTGAAFKEALIVRVVPAQGQYLRPSASLILHGACRASSPCSRVEWWRDFLDSPRHLQTYILFWLHRGFDKNWNSPSLGRKSHMID